MHPRNAFSTGDLKRFYDIIYRPIIAVHSSNNVSWRTPTPECEKRVKGGVAKVTWPHNFFFWGGGLTANSSKTAKGTNFKFDKHVPGIVATWPLTKVSETLAWPGSRDHDNSTVQTAAMGQIPRSTERILVYNRVITLWNSLPDIVVKAESVNSFKGRLDRFWNDQEVKFNWKADIKGSLPEVEVF